MIAKSTGDGVASSKSLGNVIVIGGGPGGSTTATLLAQHGCKVTLFERDHFPRFHIGESLIPETFWVLKRLGMIPKMQGSHFVKKYSVQFITQGQALGAVLFLGPQAARIVANLAGAPQRVRQTDARQRPRAWRRCARRGARAGSAVRRRARRRRAHSNRGRSATRSSRRRGGRCQRAKFDDHEPPGVARVGSGAEEGGVVDLLERRPARQRQRRRRDARDSGRRTSKAGSGTSRCTTTSSASASSPRTIISSKIAAKKITKRSTSKKSHAAPVCSHGSTNATRADQFYAAKEYSYRSRQAAGDGWVLVGDALRFSRSAVFLRRALGAEIGLAGRRRRGRRAAQRRHVCRAARQMGSRFQPRHGPHAPAGRANSTTASASAGSSNAIRNTKVT